MGNVREATTWSLGNAVGLAVLTVVIGLGTSTCGGATRPTSRGPIVAPGDVASAEAFYNTGLRHFERGEYALAAAAFDRAIAANPAHAYAYYYGGRAYSEQGQTARHDAHRPPHDDRCTTVTCPLHQRFMSGT